MARRVIVHVGAMKSGTTSFQHALYAHRERLADQGILVPGDTWRDQADAVWNVRGRETSLAGDRSIVGAWQRLVDEIDAWPGTAVISAELLAPVDDEVVEKVAGSLTSPEMVLSVRDLNRNLPGMWQEVVQNGEVWAWSDFLASARVRRPRWPLPDQVTAASRFWSEQDVVSIAKKWSAAGPVHVVTVPGPGAPREALLERFGEVVGFALDDAGTSPSQNTSLGVVRTDLLRRLNLELDGRELRYPAGIRLRKHVLAKTILPELDVEDERIGLPVEPWVEKIATQQITGLRKLEVSLHGDWDDLSPVDVGGADPTAVTDEQIVTAAAATHVELRAWLVHRAETSPREGWGPETIPEWGPRDGATEAGAAGAAEDAVDALADLIEWAVARTRAKQAADA
jgi:hypothetical protein